MSKFCKNCGAELADEAVMCPQCQTNLVEPKKDISQVIAEKGDWLVEKLKTDKKFLGICLGGLAGVIVILVVMGILLGGKPYEKAIKNYLDLMIKGDVDKIELMMPKEAWDYLEEEEDLDLDDIKDELEESMEYFQESLEEEYGKNIKVKFKVTDEDELSKKELDEIKEGLKEKYDISKKSVKKGYEVEVEATIKGSDDEDTDESDLIVVKIGSKWYLCSESGTLLGANIF